MSCSQTAFGTWRFNPRVREGRDAFADNTVYQVGVSIHASVKDATRIALIRRHRADVSIHASVKDATASSGFWDSQYSFQSTRP